jgi:hypothetical protein
MADDDPFSGLEIPDDQVASHLAAAQRKIARKRKKCIVVPWIWAEQLAKAKVGAAAYRVAFYLLHEKWRSQTETVKLPNAGLEEWGVGREGKRQALNQLGRLGLISCEQADRKSPVVTVKFTD